MAAPNNRATGQPTGQPRKAAPQRKGAGASNGASAKARRPSSADVHGSRIVAERNLTSYVLAGKALRVAMISSALGILGIAVGVAGWIAQPEPKFFAAGDDGRVIELVPLDRPLLKDSRLINWASNAVTESLDMDYLKYRDQLAEAQEYFTDSGFQGFIKALKDSGNLESIKKNRYIVYATLDGSPKILREAESGGRHYWQMVIPVQIGYESAEQVRNQKLDAKLTLVRVPTTESKYGVAIHRILLDNKK